MRDLDRKEAAVFAKLAKEYNLPLYTIQKICFYPFAFTKEKMANKYDTKDILLANLLRIKVKKAFLNNKTSPYVNTVIKNKIAVKNEWLKNKNNERND